MALTSRWRRILRITAFTVGVLLLGTVALVRMQQCLLRWRAERLLSDIRSLQLGKSTWADAQKIMTRWGPWGFYEGSCTEKRCGYQIAMQDIYQGFPVYSTPSNTMRKNWAQRSYWMLVSYQLFSGRPTLISARIEVLNGVIWAKDYRIVLQASPRFLPSESDFLLSGSASTVWRTGDFRGSYSPAHPEYFISRPGGCMFCVMGYSKFTPYADPAVVYGLMDFNLDCLTSIVACRNQMDIMPTAWKKFETEEKSFVSTATTNQDGPSGCPSSAEFQGRDSRDIVVAEVMSSRPEEHSPGSEAVSFRLKQRLKRAEFWNLSEVGHASLPNYMVRKDRPNIGSVIPGRDVILMISPPYEAMPQWIELSPCDILPLTDQNLAAVRRGISLDIFPSDNRRWP